MGSSPSFQRPDPLLPGQRKFFDPRLRVLCDYLRQLRRRLQPAYRLVGVYDPVDGHITGPNLTKADGGFASDSFGFDHDFNVTAADLASYYDDFRRADEKMAKARKLRDALRESPHSNTYSPRGAKLSADGGFGGNDRIGLTDATQRDDV